MEGNAAINGQMRLIPCLKRRRSISVIDGLRSDKLGHLSLKITTTTVSSHYPLSYILNASLDDLVRNFRSAFT